MDENALKIDALMDQIENDFIEQSEQESRHDWFCELLGNSGRFQQYQLQDLSCLDADDIWKFSNRLDKLAGQFEKLIKRKTEKGI
tara:strand:- start:648 stop:902 length:255 start_codon:yes stop_codon:yes gene_type:complete